MQKCAQETQTVCSHFEHHNIELLWRSRTLPHPHGGIFSISCNSLTSEKLVTENYYLDISPTWCINNTTPVPKAQETRWKNGMRIVVAKGTQRLHEIACSRSVRKAVLTKSGQPIPKQEVNKDNINKHAIMKLGIS